MNFLENILSVSLEVDDTDGTVSGLRASMMTETLKAPTTVAMTVLPRQPVRWQLTLSFDNTNGDKTADAVAFLAEIGESALQEAWVKLFDRLVVCPFLLDRGDTEAIDASHSLCLEGEEEEEKLPVVASKPTCSPTPVADASSGSTLEVGARFAFGVPLFWNDRLYLDEDDPHPPSPVASVPRGAGLVGGGDADLPLPRPVHVLVPRNSSNASLSPHLPCRVAGHPVEVTCEAVHFTSMPTPARPDPGGHLTAPSMPAQLTSTYHIDFTVPDGEAWLDGDAAFGFVLLLPLEMSHGSGSGGGSGASSAGGGGGGAGGVSTTQVVAQVLARAFVDPFASGVPGWLNRHSLLLGCCYVPVNVRRALGCHSVTCPLSNDRLVLNLMLTNESPLPVVLRSASFDLYATQVCRRADNASDLVTVAEACQWVEQRPGPAGADMRMIDILTKVVTVTPMVVSDDRPPFTLQSGETYSFQFIVQVVAQLCYVLNPKSLEYVYASYHATGKGGQDGTTAGGAPPSSSPPTVVMPGAVSSGASVLVRDVNGKAVSNEEIVAVLSSTYLSYLCVHYDIAPATATATENGCGGGTIKNGLHLRHAARWSFGV